MALQPRQNDISETIDRILEAHGLSGTLRLLGDACKREGDKAKKAHVKDQASFWEENYRRLDWLASNLSGRNSA